MLSFVLPREIDCGRLVARLVFAQILIKIFWKKLFEKVLFTCLLNTKTVIPLNVGE